MPEMLSFTKRNSKPLKLIDPGTSKIIAGREAIIEAFPPASICQEYKYYYSTRAVTIALNTFSHPKNGWIRFRIDLYEAGTAVFNGDFTNYYIDDHNFNGDIKLGFARFSNKKVMFFNYTAY